MALVSTYDLGRQPFGLASPAAWLRDAGHDVVCVDTSRVPLPAGLVATSGMLAFHLPMHTATRLAVPLIARVRAANPEARLVAYGLYAPLNDAALRKAGIDVVLGVECEPDLVAIAAGDLPAGVAPPRGVLPRIGFRVPDRSALPPLQRYAHLRLPNGARRVAGYTEASRGCKHWCRHCPVVPVYAGQFRVVPVDVVMADIAQQVDAGATHITFGDPDFFNGPRHACAIVKAFAERFEGLTYDVTIKVEHLVRHADLLPALTASGCVLVTSAVESFDDDVLGRLQKGHTAAETERAVTACVDAGLSLAPTFVAFTPWTTPGGYVEFLERIASLGLVEHVASIQLALRLLLPSGSLLLEDATVRRVVGDYDAERLVHPWTHPDPAVDALQRDVEALVASRPAATRGEVFSAAVDLADLYVESPRSPRPDVLDRAAVPYLEEPWYC